MRTFTAVVERNRRTGRYVGYISGFPEVQSEGETIEELYASLKVAITLLFKNSEPDGQADFIGTQTITIE